MRKRNRDSTLFYFYFGALFLVLPLIRYSQAMDYYLMPRLTVLSLLLLLSAMYVLGARRMKEFDFSVFRHKLFYFLAGFVLLTLLAAFFAANRSEVFFDVVRTLVFAGGVAVSTLLLMRTPDWEQKLSKLVVVAALIAVIIGLRQYVSDVIPSEQTLLPDGRIVEYLVTGFMGHKNIYSVFLLLLLPFTIFGAVCLPRAWKVLSIAAAISIVVVLLLLKTRSAWVGMALGAGSATVLLLVFSRKFHLPSKWRNLIIGLMAMGFVGLAALVWIGKSADQYSVPGRVYSIFDTTSPHNIHRLNVWKGSLQMVADYPITGVGPGNWKIMVPPYYNRQFSQAVAMNWARPHNDYLWVASEKGIPALLCYLGIFFFGLYYLLCCLKNSSVNEGNRRWFILLVLFGLIAYMTDSFFSFPYERLELQAILMVMTAVSVVLYHEKRPRRALTPHRSVLLFTTLLVFGFGAVYGHQAIRLEREIKAAMGALTQQQWPRMLQHAIDAESRFRKADPQGYPVAYSRGLAYAGMGRHREALEAFLQARDQSPHHVVVLFHLGTTSMALGNYDQAKASFERIIELMPPEPPVMHNLGIVYYELGAYEKALEALTSIPGWENNPSTKNNVEVLRRLLK